jgi:N-acetyl-beta-hexosaminidase
VCGFTHLPCLVSITAAIKGDCVICARCAAVFPSRYTMMGGDEVNLKALEGLPEIQAAAKKLGGNASSYDLYRSFIAEMHAYANASGRELIV